MTYIDIQINDRLAKVAPFIPVMDLRNLPVLATIIDDIVRFDAADDDDDASAAAAAVSFRAMTAIAEGVAAGFELGHDAAGGE